MALQVWLPLNGDLHNQGLNQSVTATNHGATVNDSGKIGKCYQFGTSTSYLALSKQAMRSCTTEVSICFWLKILTWNSSYATYFQAGLNGSAWPNYTFGLLRNNANSNCCFTISDGTSSSKASYLTPSLEIDTWYHVSLLYKTGHCLIYINGQLYKDYTASIVPNFSSIDRITLGMCNNYSQYQSNCQINDFRIYNHALSPKEVEDISKGLVLHYKLDNNGMGNENYWTNGQPQVDTWANPCTNELRTMIARTSASYVSYPTTVPNEYTEIKFLSTREQIDDGGLQLQKMQRYSEDVNGMCPILENLNAGEYFTLSYELYVNSPVNVKFHISKRVNGTSSKAGPSIFQVSTVNTWTKISQSIQITSDFDKSNITAEVDFLGAFLSIQDILGVTTSDEVVIKVRNIKLERGQEATPWTPARADFGHADDNVIYDYSGYGNNGTIVGNLTVATGSPRYDVYTNLTTTSTHIYTPALTTAGFANSFSISWWGNVSTYSGKMMWGFQDGNRLNGIYGGNLWNTGDSSSNPLYTPGTTTQVKAPTVNIWHHFVMTGDGSACKVYKDGQLWAQAKTYKSLTGTIIYFNGWANATNYALANTKISDFRLYATALTADQVKELYQTSMLVDTSGNIMPRGLEEV